MAEKVRESGMGFGRASKGRKRRRARSQSCGVGWAGSRVWRRSRRGAWRARARRRRWRRSRQRSEAVSVWSKKVERRRVRRVGRSARASWTRSRVGLRWWTWASTLERVSL
ncbi:hypothetical protein E2542_SST28287 [Spatholobus suberectus]|nr:hypothetical protein E2542_SST28287 [Spatholobus suberectus]